MKQRCYAPLILFSLLPLMIFSIIHGAPSFGAGPASGPVMGLPGPRAPSVSAPVNEPMIIMSEAELDSLFLDVPGQDGLSLATAYRFSGLSIDAENSGNCLYLQGIENRYVIISDSEFLNSGPGEPAIYVKGSARVQIQNVNISWSAYGVWIENSNNTVVRGSSIVGAEVGIAIGGGYGTTISRNSIVSCTSNGIETTNARSATISGNIIFSSADSGIKLGTGTTQTLVQGNRLELNGDGILVESFGNTIENNILESNTCGLRVRDTEEVTVALNRFVGNQDGASFEGASRCTVTENNFIDNSRYGMMVNQSNLLAIYLNNFLEKGIDHLFLVNFDPSGAVNKFDNGHLGNYWDDYSVLNPGVSALGNVYGVPYVVAGSYTPVAEYEEFLSDTKPLTSPHAPAQSNLAAVVVVVLIVPFAPLGIVILVRIIRRYV